MSETNPKTNNNKHQQQQQQSSESSSNGKIKVRCIVQQCTNAKLQTKLEDKENAIRAEHVQINRGAVFFVCFMKDAEQEDVEKLVKSALNAKLSESENDPNKHISILDLPGDILIIPQATLGGQMKGKMFQYHNNINKDKGLELYNHFVDLCKKATQENEHWSKSERKVEHGTYGIKQVYSTETNGPYLHLIEF